MALSAQHTVLETPQPWEGAQKHPAMGHSPTPTLGGTEPWSLFPHSTHPQSYPCPTEPSPTPTVLILNPTDLSLPHGVCPNPTVLILNLRHPSLLHRAHLQLLHSPQNLSGNTHPWRAVLGRACLDDLLEEPPFPPAPRPAQHHAQVHYSQSSEACQASRAGPALQLTHIPRAARGVAAGEGMVPPGKRPETHAPALSQY